MIATAVAAVKEGRVVGLPTDTVYGIGADPLNDQAVELLFDLKGRPEHKPVGLLVASVEQALEVAELGAEAENLARAHWPGALTLVATPKVILADWVGDSQRRTLGVRVPAHPVAVALLTAAGPMAVTSANRSGGAEATNANEARAIFGDGVAVYLEGECPGRAASTVVDVTGSRIRVLRPGPVAL